MHSLFPLCWVALFAFATPPEAFESHVRPTDPLTPAQQQQTFHLPPGFAIVNFSAEPDIQKPMNMAFDARGRLWVTGSIEYPYAAKPGEGRDTVRILEDADGDGHAEKVTVFADGLNIPIGLYPYRDGVVVYSQPHIWFLRDTNGDDRADTREILYADLGIPRDTHGMQNAFRRGFDGWLYVCHGFANHTVIRGRDGSSITLDSGNTYRLRLDGSRVEQYTQGQVNPFGMAFMPNGDIITADCHSKPLTLLLRGGCYQSFGRPHDGLGFVQDLTPHSHGSTAICGVAIPTGNRFPASYRGKLLVGNVMTCRVHCDRLRYDGATPTAVEEPDFISTDDPWFRPVDLQFGPDDALYVADFYNKIIGHYEVPLEHPERDRTRGRIWRVSYTGVDSNDNGMPSRPVRLDTASIEQLISALGHDNLTVRMLAMDQCSDRIGPPAIPALRQAFTSTANPTARVHIAWTLRRLNALTTTDIESLYQADDAIARVHAMRMLGEKTDWSQDEPPLAERGLSDADPTVRRLAAEACSLQPHPATLDPLLNALSAARTTDQHQRQSIRIALRNHLRTQLSATIAALESAPLEHRQSIIDIVATIPSEATAGFLMKVLQQSDARRFSGAEQAAYLTHVGEYLPLDQTESWVEFVQARLADELNIQFDVLERVRSKFTAANKPLPESVVTWARQLTARVYPSVDNAKLWSITSGGNPWQTEKRNCEDGTASVEFLSSFPGGEQTRSTLRSPTFIVPARLSFYLCGHRGFPEAEALDKNLVQLKLANSHEVVERAYPPRNDVARKIEWDLKAWQGQSAYIEIVDGLDLTAYAWLAVARFTPDVVRIPSGSTLDSADLAASAIGLIGQFGWQEFAPHLRASLLQDAGRTIDVAATRSLLQLTTHHPLAPILAELVQHDGTSDALRRKLCTTIAQSNADYQTLLAESLPSLDYATQRQLADLLAAAADTTPLLSLWMEEGRISPQLLHSESLWQKLTARAEVNNLQRWTALRNAAPAVDTDMLDKINQLVALAKSSDADHTAGATLFQKNCSVCHKIGDKGNLVGPQLDGIGSRGAQRIAEDVLLPNRNVDQAFRVSVLALSDGRVLTGLKRREEGTRLIFANDKGEEFTIDQQDLDEIQASNLSLMPDGFAKTLTAKELASLIAYLAAL